MFDRRRRGSTKANARGNPSPRSCAPRTAATIDRPHRAGRRLVAAQPSPDVSDDQHPVPRNDVADQHGDRPVRVDLRRARRPARPGAPGTAASRSARLAAPWALIALAMPIGVVPSARGQIRLTPVVHPDLFAVEPGQARSTDGVPRPVSFVR